MDLLDEEAEFLIRERQGLKPPEDNGGKVVRNRKLAGLAHRFGNLNKANELAEKYRKKPIDQTSDVSTMTADVGFKHQTKVSETTLAPETSGSNELKNAPIEKVELSDREVARNLTTIDHQIAIKQSPIGDHNVTNLATNRNQLVTEPVTQKDQFPNPRELSGNQKQIVYLVFSEMLKNGNNQTSKMPTRIIAEIVKTSEHSIRQAIYRLTNKGFLISVHGKRGRGGWAIYSIPEQVFRAIQMDSLFFSDASPLGYIKSPKQSPKASSSSSFNYTNNTTTSDTLPVDWASVDLAELDGIGFTKTHLTQIYRSGKSSVDLVRDSIEALRHDIRNNKIPKHIQSPLGLIMKLLRVNGEAYSSFDKSFETDSERAVREMREIAYRRKAEKEKLEEELFQLKFEEWREKMSAEDLQALVPPLIKGTTGPAFEGAIRNYFNEKVYRVG